MAEEKETPFLDPNPFHDDEESSPRKSGDFDTKSEYEDIDAVKTTSEVQNLLFSFSSNRRHIRIISEKYNAPKYYVEFSRYTPGKPDVTLHAGGEDTGNVLGVCKLPELTKGFAIGLGDPGVNNGDKMLWEDVDFKGTWLTDPQYGWIMAPDSGSDRRSFRWKRESYLNWKLVDEGVGETRATFQSNGLKSWSKMGKMKISGDLGRELEIGAVLVMSGIFQKARKRRGF